MSLILTQGALPNDALGQLFSEARTYAYWQDKPVEDETLRHLYELMKFAPTSVNCSPLRIKFLRTDDAKAKLDPALSEGNRHKVHAAPVTAILAYDRGFHRHLPELFPHADAKSWFVGNEPYREETAFRNSSLQGGYFILAARPWVWMPGRCRDLITTWWTGSSLLKATLITAAIFCATWVTATAASSTLAALGWRLSRYASFYK
ncbi:malonic semialdehyde reductase [Halomonas sp. BDJS001]|nr:malonic semialdehyde reductase [Halomonas sp. BDJS001]UZH09654.1 malonic semialdehyde reductase [Halomonas sp. BDJS001]